jgi:hypothetical protein
VAVVIVVPATGLRSVRHHQPNLRVQRSKTNEMASMIKHKIISGIHLVESLTMTFMPKTDDREVIGRVIAAITASRSASNSHLGVGTRTIELGDTLLKPHRGLADAGDRLILVEHILHLLQALGRCERGQPDSPSINLAALLSHRFDRQQLMAGREQAGGPNLGPLPGAEACRGWPSRRMNAALIMRDNPSSFGRAGEI